MTHRQRATASATVSYLSFFLKCDLFISHAWKEGFYEFIDKVLASWPPGATGAWICAYANPQNLDIGNLIAHPKDSPFALALKEADYVMVVANRQLSIYSRMWCGYEAYLAYDQNKYIFTAWRPVGNWKFEPFIVLLVGVLVSLNLWFVRFPLPLCIHAESGSFATDCRFSKDMRVAFKCAISVFAYAFIGGEACFADVKDSCNVIVRVLRFIIHARGFLLIARLVARIYDLAPESNQDATLLLFGIAGLIIQVAMTPWVYRELLRSDHMHQEMALIKCEGSIKQANCSSEKDKAAIAKEIDEHDQWDKVDDSIKVLMNSGVSTEEVRTLHRDFKIDVARMAEKQLGPAIVSWTACCRTAMQQAYFVFRGGNPDTLTYAMVAFLALMSLIFPFCWSYLYLRDQRIERQVFACHAATIFPNLAAIGSVIMGFILDKFGWTDTSYLTAILIFMFGISTLIVSFAGPLSTAQFGRCGCWLTKIMVNKFHAKIMGLCGFLIALVALVFQMLKCFEFMDAETTAFPIILVAY